MSDAELSKLLFEAREQISMWADVVEKRARRSPYLDSLRDRIDQFRMDRGWSPHGFGGEGDRGDRLSRMRELDGMAEFAKLRKLWPAYHFIRAWAHERGMHLSSCTGGRRLEGDAIVSDDDLQSWAVPRVDPEVGAPYPEERRRAGRPND